MLVSPVIALYPSLQRGFSITVCKSDIIHSSGTIRADDVVVEQRSRGMSLREVKKNKVDDITDGKEKVAVVKTKVCFRWDRDIG